MGTLLVAGKASQRCTQLLIDWLRLAAHKSMERERREEKETEKERQGNKSIAFYNYGNSQTIY